jgi:16S rRNA (uracil1498-N3)-methyltransferase
MRVYRFSGIDCADPLSDPISMAPRIPRIYSPPPLRQGAVLELRADAFQHLVRVLRLGPGDAIRLFDGQGLEFEARLEAVGRRSAQVRIGTGSPASVESPLEVILAQAISRGDRMDYALQKAAELGVSEIVPIVSARSRIPTDSDRIQRKRTHWQGVIAAACEQSGRAYIPPLQAVRTLPDWLEAGLLAGVQGLVLDPGAEAGLNDCPRPQGPVAVLIGPESGLTDDELAQARGRGLRPVRLGPRILRTETAGVAVLAALQVLWGDLG